MKLYRFERGLEVAVSTQPDGTNLPRGQLWDGRGLVVPPADDLGAPWDVILNVVRDVGFFIWPLRQGPKPELRLQE
jgi:hypothetical protein